MPGGIFGQLPPGLRGYVAAEQAANQRSANEFNMRRGIFGLQQEMQAAPIQREMQQLQLEQMRKPAPTRVDLGGEIGLVDPRSGAIIGRIPKVATPDAIMRERGADKRHQVPSGSSVLGAQSSIRGQDIGAQTAQRSQDITLRGQDLTNQIATARAEYEGVPLRPLTQPAPQMPGAPGVPSVPAAAVPAAPGAPQLSPKAKAELAAKRAEDAPKAQAALQDMNANLDRMADATKRVANHPGLPAAVGMGGWRTLGLPGERFIPGSPAASFHAQLMTLKSQIGFSVLQAMRNASKTGGALGQVSEIENKLLQENLAALDTSQSESEFKQNLQVVLDYVEGVKQRLGSAYQQEYGGAVPLEAPQRRSTDKPDDVLREADRILGITR